jgi:hypothetical protein
LVTIINLINIGTFTKEKW